MKWIKMRKHLFLLPLLLSLVLLSATTALAFTFRASYTISENGTASYDMLPVLEASNNQWMIDNGFIINADALDTRIETLGGLVRPHMVVDNMTLTAVVVPLASQTNLYFTTGNSLLSNFDIIAGWDGYITTADNTTLEIAGNFTIEQTGWVDTTLPSGGTPFFSDDFDTDDWTDVGANIVVNVGTERLEYNVSNGDHRTSYDLGVGVVSDTLWRMEFTFYPDSHPFNAFFGIGIMDSLGNLNGYGGDGITFYKSSTADVVKLQRYDGGVTGSSPTITLVEDTTYYVTLERTSATEASLSIFSDIARVFHVAGSPVTLTIPSTVQSLRYVQASSYDAAPATAKGWIDDLEIFHSASAGVRYLVQKQGAFSTLVSASGNITSICGSSNVTATGVSSGERIVTTSANITHLRIAIDGTIVDTAVLSANVTDNANDWIWVSGNSMPYSDNISLEVNGTQELFYEPTTFIIGDNLPDRGVGVSNNGTFTWGANPTGVTISLGSMVSSAQPVPGQAISEPAQDILPEVEVSDWFVPPDVSGTLLTNPIRPFVTILSDNSTLTEIQAWRWLAFAFVLLVTVSTARAVRGHHFITGIACGASWGAMVAQTIFPLWCLVFIIGMLFAGLKAERTPSL